MNILILTPELYPYIGGGVAMHTYFLSKLLANTPKYKAILFTACPKGTICELKSSYAEKVNVIRLLPFPLASISYIVKSLTLFLLVKRKTNLNVIHAHGASAQTMFVASLMSVMGKIPFLVTAHGSEIRISKKAKTVKLMQKFLLKKASYVTCVSNEIKQILTSEYGLEDCKTSIVPNGYDENLISKRKEGHSHSKEKKFVFVGGLRAAKDPSTLLRAFKKVSIRYADAKLLVIGDGPLRNDLEALCKRLDISNRVSFYGQVSHEKAITMIAECDIYVLTSIDEGLPTSLVEAMALGTPVIATRIGGVPEIVEDGVNGLLVPSRSPEQVAYAMDELLNDPELAQRLARAATKSVQDYSWSEIVKKYEQIYEALTSQS